MASKTADEPDIDPVALRIAQRLRLNTDRLRRVVRASGGENELPRPQEAVLSLLERRGPLTTADLARHELLRPQTMGTIVAELCAKGLATKEPHATDRRRSLVTLTPLGTEKVVAISAIRDRGLAQLIHTSLDRTQRQQLLRGVELVESLAAEPT